MRDRRSRQGRVGRRSALALVLGGLPLMLPLSPTLGAEDEGYAKRIRTFQEIRREGVVIQRWDLSCGAAALATVLAYQHSDPVPERQIARAMLAATDPGLVRRRLGFSLLDLKRFVATRGYLGEGYGGLAPGDLERLAPAIVPIRLQTFDHFVVFRGFERGRAVLADPAYGTRTMPAAGFLRAWRGHIAFVVRREGRIPTPGRLALPDANLLLVPEQAVRAVLP